MKKHGSSLPGPPLPAVVQTALWARRPFELFDGCRARYGDIFRIRLLSIGELVYIADPKAIRKLFAGDGRVAHAGESNAAIEPVAGPCSMLRIDREEHLTERRMLTPAFHGEAIRRLEVVAQEAAEREEAQWPEHEPVRIREAMQRITFEIIIDAILGVQDARLRDHFLKLFYPVFALGPYVGNPLLGKDLGPLSPGGRFRRSSARLDAALFELIAERRGAPEQADVLGTLLAARDASGQPLSDRHVRDELVTLLLAGHETSATSLAWACERLARHPAICEELREQVAAGEEELLDAVVKETLRVRPVLTGTGRSLSEPMELCGHLLPAGTVVAPAIAAVHFDERNFERAHEFRPHRFVGDGSDPAVWLPFGGGRRRCIGAALALMELRVILRTVVERRELLPVKAADERPHVHGMTFVPHRGAELRLPRSRPRPSARRAEVLAPAGAPTA